MDTPRPKVPHWFTIVLWLLGFELFFAGIGSAALRMQIPPNLTWRKTIGYVFPIFSLLVLLLGCLLRSTMLKEIPRDRYVACVAVLTIVPFLIGLPGMLFLFQRTKTLETLTIASAHETTKVGGFITQQSSFIAITPAFAVRFAESPEEFTLDLSKPITVGQFVDLTVYRVQGRIYKVRLGNQVALPN